MIANPRNGKQDQLAAGLLSKSTIEQRTGFYDRLMPDHGEKRMAMPKRAVIEIRDSMASTPGAADNMVKSIRALYV